MVDDETTITAERFVDVVHDHVFRSAVSDTFSIIEDPPGRQPPEWLVELHDWFETLSPTDRAMVRRVAEDAAEGAVFGLLCLLDNVRPVVDGFAEELRLNVEGPSGERRLRPDAIELHGLFRDRVDDGRDPTGATASDG